MNKNVNNKVDFHRRLEEHCIYEHINFKLEIGKHKLDFFSKDEQKIINDKIEKHRYNYIRERLKRCFKRLVKIKHHVNRVPNLASNIELT